MIKNRSWVPYHRTKIVATLGPATDDPEILRRCLRAGMDIARLNYSHGTDPEKKRRVDSFRRAAAELAQPVGLLVDLPGPKFRLGALPGGSRELRRGESVVLGPPDHSPNGDLPVRHPAILSQVAAGHSLFLADGTVGLRAISRAGRRLRCRVTVGGTIRSGSGINLPDTNVRVAFPTAEDRRGIAFAIARKAEWIGVSFVRTAQDIRRIRRALGRAAHRPLLVAKIEMRQALENLDAIIREADDVMVARGDLGVETPLARVPLVQKDIIARANAQGKPVITATQMLESMVTHRWPTRAEATDVANAALDGTDAVMLSAETAIGEYPAEAVRMLGSVLQETEQAYPFRQTLEKQAQTLWTDPRDAVGLSACRLAWDVGAKAIVIASPSSRMPFRVSRFRPPMPILHVSADPLRARQLSLAWGVRSLVVRPNLTRSFPLESARRWLRRERLAKAGDRLIWIHSPLPGSESADVVQLIHL